MLLERFLRSAVCLIFLFGSPGLLCADTDAADPKLTEEPLQLAPIVVTAEKREETVQAVPASISAFTAPRIADARIATIQDLSLVVPNLFIANWGIRGTSHVFVRGIGAVNNDPAVGFYVDDVNYMAARVFDTNLFDIERIEVLRGPQGTLYGRNSLGGVVNIVTRKPDNALHAGVDQTVGNYNRLQTNLHARGPLVADKLFLGLAGGFEKRDGYTKNDYLGTDTDHRKALNGRLHLRWLPTDTLDVTLGVDAEKIDDGAFPLTRLDRLRERSHRINYDFEGRYEREAGGAALRVGYDGAAFRLTAISAFRRFDDMAVNDQDFTPLPLMDANEDIRDRQWSQELRLASPDDGRAFKWLAGLYGFRKDQDHRLQMNVAAGLYGPEALALDYRSDLGTHGYAAFGQATQTLFHKLDITAGLRYDYEKSRLDYASTMKAASQPGPGMPLQDLDESTDSTAVLPKVQVGYHWTPTLMTYAGVTRGYRSGGFNTGFMDLADAAFDPEYSWNYEAGIKSEWFHHRLVLNAAVFLIDLRDQQVVQLLPDANTVVRNVGKSRSLGVEVEARALLSAGLTVEAGFGYTRAEYVDYENPLAGEDFAKNKTPLAPEYTYNLALQYRRPLVAALASPVFKGPLSLLARAELNGVGPFYWNDANTLRQDAYHLFNLNIGLETRHVDLLLWTRNLFDTQYKAVAFEFPGSDPVGQSGDPMTIGVTCRVRF